MTKMDDFLDFILEDIERGIEEVSEFLENLEKLEDVEFVRLLRKDLERERKFLALNLSFMHRYKKWRSEK